MRSALQDLIGEQPAFARKVPRHLKFSPDITAYFGYRIAFRIERAQRVKPGVEDAVDQRPVHRLFGAEIIEQIRLRHARHLGDLIDGRTAKAVCGKHLQRRLENLLLLLLLDSRAPLGSSRSRKYHFVPCPHPRRMTSGAICPKYGPAGFLSNNSCFLFFPLECCHGSCNVYQPVKLSGRLLTKATPDRRAYKQARDLAEGNKRAIPRGGTGRQKRRTPWQHLARIGASMPIACGIR